MNEVIAELAVAVFALSDAKLSGHGSALRASRLMLTHYKRAPLWSRFALSRLPKVFVGLIYNRIISGMNVYVKTS